MMKNVWKITVLSANFVFCTVCICSEEEVQDQGRAPNVVARNNVANETTVRQLMRQISGNSYEVFVPWYVTCIITNDLQVLLQRRIIRVVFEEGSRLKRIEATAFRGVQFPTLDLPASIEQIGRDAFSGNAKLSEVRFGSDSELQEIGDEAFAGCSSLRTFCSRQCRNLTKIGSGAFAKCTALQALYIPNSVQKIGEGAFWGTKIAISLSEDIIPYQSGDGEWPFCVFPFVTKLFATPDSTGEIAKNSSDNIVYIRRRDGSIVNVKLINPAIQEWQYSDGQGSVVLKPPAISFTEHNGERVVEYNGFCGKQTIEAPENPGDGITVFANCPVLERCVLQKSYGKSRKAITHLIIGPGVVEVQSYALADCKSKRITFESDDVVGEDKSNGAIAEFLSRTFGTCMEPLQHDCTVEFKNGDTTRVFVYMGGNYWAPPRVKKQKLQ
ncbi:MAG: leucine-rich repeat domain-containing protein [Holosporales bacterium]|jgi:hypothetical protein|nr:leucine-rich repeat domain-containing protein [Holosporales bacterium]